MEMVVDNSAADASSELDARAWLIAHKEAEKLSWPQIGKLADVPPSTLSAFSSGKYAGDNTKVAAKILAYRDRLTAQAGDRGRSAVIAELVSDAHRKTDHPAPSLGAVGQDRVDRFRPRPRQDQDG